MSLLQKKSMKKEENWNVFSTQEILLTTQEIQADKQFRHNLRGA